MRRRPAGWRRRWRRSGPAGVRSGTGRCAEMNEPVASDFFPMGADGTTAHTANGLKRLASRYPSENSNARLVRAPFGRGFIAAIDLLASELFLDDFRS